MGRRRRRRSVALREAHTAAKQQQKAYEALQVKFEAEVKARTTLAAAAESMAVERDVRYELLSRLCPNATGAEIHSVCTEAGMFAIRQRRKTVNEKDFLDAVAKVIKGYQKFSSTAKYMQYN